MLPGAYKVDHLRGLGASTSGDALPPLCERVQGFLHPRLGRSYPADTLLDVVAHARSQLREVGRRWLDILGLERLQHQCVGLKGTVIIPLSNPQHLR